MKTTELINIIKKYLDDEVRLIIRSEIKLAFKELIAENIQPKQIVKKQIDSTVLVKKPITESIKSTVKNIPILKSPIKMGNPVFDNILAQTKHEMINNPISQEEEVESETINALMTGATLPAGRTISLTTGDITVNDQIDIEQSINEPIYENIEAAKIPSVEDFIKMKRE